MTQALRAYHDGDRAAGDAALATRDPLVRAAVEWVFLRAKPAEAGLTRHREFLAAHPGWPDAALRRHAEELAGVEDVNPERAKAYLAAYPSDRPRGRSRHGPASGRGRRRSRAKTLAHRRSHAGAGKAAVETVRRLAHPRGSPVPRGTHVAARAEVGGEPRRRSRRHVGRDGLARGQRHRRWRDRFKGCREARRDGPRRSDPAIRAHPRLAQGGEDHRGGQTVARGSPRGGGARWRRLVGRAPPAVAQTARRQGLQAPPTRSPRDTRPRATRRGWRPSSTPAGSPCASSRTRRWPPRTSRPWPRSPARLPASLAPPIGAAASRRRAAATPARCSRARPAKARPITGNWRARGSATSRWRWRRRPSRRSARPAPSRCAPPNCCSRWAKRRLRGNWRSKPAPGCRPSRWPPWRKSWPRRRTPISR